MKKWLMCFLGLGIFSFFGASNALEHAVLNGNQSCAKRFPEKKYCFPIHAASSLKSNEVLIIKFSGDSFNFMLLSNQTGFTSANNPAPAKGTVKVSLGTFGKSRVVQIEKTIYEGSLGANKVGLNCDETNCLSWLN